MLKFITKSVLPSVIGFIFLFSLMFVLSTSSVLAQPTGYDTNLESGGADSVAWAGEAGEFQDGTGLGNNNPKKIVANIINITLGFLGIISICIIMYAGFLWMMSGGNPDKINKAKRILIGGFIGMVIVLSSFAIASFVLDLIYRATTPGSGGSHHSISPISGDSCISLCAGNLVCIAACNIHPPHNNAGDRPCSSATDGTCSPDESMCDVFGEDAWHCNTTTCLCEVDNMGSCYNEYENACTRPCRYGLSCFGYLNEVAETGLCDDNGGNPDPLIGSCGPNNESCYCCCDPALANTSADTCKLIYPTLDCRADQGDCSGTSRGLCCGCDHDNQCNVGASSENGCADDTCCHDRPMVTETTPSDGAVDRCTNSRISIHFDQPMKPSSLSDNVFLVGSYAGPCPENTTLFDTTDPTFPELSDNDTTYNHCSVNGSVRVRNIANDHNVDFIPSNFLDINTLYHIVVRGDIDISNNIDEGILNYWGVSMHGSYPLTGFAPSFRTINDPDTGGVCKIESIVLSPSNYLFQTNQDSIREVDDATSDTFDTAKDNDKAFYANTISDSYQVIEPMNGYRWNVEMEITLNDGAVVNLIDEEAGLNRYNDPIDDPADMSVLNNGIVLIDVRPGVTDDRSRLRATIDMEQYLPTVDNGGADGNNTIDDGSGYYDQSDIYVFICDNPWPPVDPSGSWDTWKPNDPDNSIDPGNPNPFNFDIYYCRDKGNKGTLDDLPAFDSAGVAGTPDDQVLQQVYFSYQSPPPPGTIRTATSTDNNTFVELGTVANPATILSPESNDETDLSALVEGGHYFKGKTVYLEWVRVSNDYAGTPPPPIPTEKQIGGYNVHWGTRSGVYTNHVDVGDRDNVYITGLTNGKKYYFSVTVYTNDKVESEYYDEIGDGVVPVDVVPPQEITAFRSVVSNTDIRQTEIDLYWTEVPGAYDYRISYGFDTDTSSMTSLTGAYDGITVKGLNPDTYYSFVIRVVDEAGNSGTASSPIREKTEQ